MERTTSALMGSMPPGLRGRPGSHRVASKTWWASIHQGRGGALHQPLPGHQTFRDAWAAQPAWAARDHGRPSWQGDRKSNKFPSFLRSGLSSQCTTGRRIERSGPLKQLTSTPQGRCGASGFVEMTPSVTGVAMGGSGGRGLSGVVNELLVQLQSLHPDARQRVAWAWIDLLNRYLPDGGKLHKPPSVPQRAQWWVPPTARTTCRPRAHHRHFDPFIYFGLPGRGRPCGWWHPPRARWPARRAACAACCRQAGTG